jgi:hypothetical protein
MACVPLPLSRRKRFITRLHHCGPPEIELTHSFSSIFRSPS